MTDSDTQTAPPPLTHLAIIMDGNGRWARERGLPRIEGHKAGVDSVQKTVEFCRRRGIRYLTLFSFSTENWQRAPEEVSGLMQLFRHYLDTELSRLNENNIRLRAIGDIERLPFHVRTALNRNIEKTKNNTELTLVLAVSYGGREEIVAAAKTLAEKVAKGTIAPADIDNQLFASALWGADFPDPDLLIRTSAEMRISNFLLWQLAYSEIVVAPEFWPDFNEQTLERCLKEYAARERRFGLTSEQLKTEADDECRATSDTGAKKTTGR